MYTFIFNFLFLNQNWSSRTEVPKEEPLIEGTKHEYRIGDTANIVCVSAKSRPPATLTWYINGEKV